MKLGVPGTPPARTGDSSKAASGGASDQVRQSSLHGAEVRLQGSRDQELVLEERAGN